MRFFATHCSQTKRRILSTERILNKIREYAFIFDALIPIAPLNGKRSGRCRVSLGPKYQKIPKRSPEIPSVEEIKKSIKTANRKHPDKLMSKGLPAQWLKIATEISLLFRRLRYFERCRKRMMQKG